MHFIGTVVVYVKIYFTARKSLPHKYGAKIGTGQKTLPIIIVGNGVTSEVSAFQKFTSKNSPEIEKIVCNRRKANFNFEMKTNHSAVEVNDTRMSDDYENRNVSHQPTSSNGSPNKKDGKRSGDSNVYPRNQTTDGVETSQYYSSQAEYCARKNLLHNIKLANSCRLVVIISLISFATPIIVVGVRPIDLGQHFIEVASWCNLFYFSNSFLNCIIFFWRVAILKNEAKAFLKRVWLTIARKN